MIIILLFGLLFSAEELPKVENAREIFYQDAQSYEEGRNNYIKYFAKYRDIKFSEDYRNRIFELEKDLSKGNQALLKTVENFEKDQKDKVLFDDELLIRLAQLEFEKANFEMTKAMENGTSFVKPDYSNSISYAKRLLRNYPSSQLADSAEYLIAYIHEELGQFDEAKRIYEHFVKEYPHSNFYNEVRWRLSEIQFEQGEIKESRKGYLELAKKINSKFEFKALYKLGATLYDSSLYDWSSKMFMRLYDRLKDDHVSNAERITLFDETLEYLGLLKRKGIALELNEDIDAKSTKKVLQAFKRHGLFEAASKTYQEYIANNMLSPYLPEFYDNWIEFELGRGNTKKAQGIRNEYLRLITTNREWWIKNKENHQARFFAEASLEGNLLNSARYQASLNKPQATKQAIATYEYYLKNYGLGRDADVVRLELSKIYYNNNDYKLAYETLKGIPLKENYNLIYDSIYYIRAVSGIREKIYSKQELLDEVYTYVEWTKNYHQSASLISSTAYLFSSKEDLYKHYAKLPYKEVNLATDQILNAYKQYEKYGLELKKESGDFGLYSKLALKKFIQIPTSGNLNLIEDYIRSGFLSEAQDLIASSSELSQDEKAYYQAYILRQENSIRDSITKLKTISSNKIKNQSQLLLAKNYFDILDLSSAQKNIATLPYKFRKKYLESDYLKYKTSLLQKNYQHSWQAASFLYEQTKDFYFLEDLSSYLHAYNKINGKWKKKISAYPKLAKLYGLVTCKEKIKACVYQQAINALDKKNIELVLVSLRELKDNDAYELVEKFYFEVVNRGHLSWLIQEERFSSFYQEVNIAQNRSGPYYHKTKILHNRFQKSPMEYLIPWDIALHEIIGWQARGPAAESAKILCQEGQWQRCLEQLGDQNKEALFKYHLMALNKDKVIDLYGTTIYKNDKSLALLLDINNSDEVEGDHSELAKIQRYINKGQSSKAFQQSLSLIKKNPKIVYPYVLNLKSSLLMNDYPSFYFVLQKMNKNTNNTWSNMVMDLMYQDASWKEKNIYHYNIVNAWKKKDLKYINDNTNTSWATLSKAIMSLYHNEEYKIEKKEGLFPSTNFLLALQGVKGFNVVSQGLYNQYLKEHKRNIASEVEK